MTPVKNMVGIRFGKWIVLRRAASAAFSQNATWFCQCNCGTQRAVRGNRLRGGHSKSCGCDVSERARIQVTTHNETKTKLYRLFSSMISRCENPKNACYKYYGARGIRVCPRWRHSFESFKSDMGQRPSGRSLDRIDNDGNYDPENCRWATHKEQSANRRPFKKP